MTRSQGEAASSEPVEKRDGNTTVSLHDGGLRVGGVGILVPSAESPHQVPEAIALEELPFLGIGAGCDGGGDPPVEPGHLLVPWRERTGGDEDGTEVLDRLGSAKVVESVVAERSPAFAKFSQDS